MQLRTTHTLSINDEDRKLNNEANKPSSGSGCINIDDPKRLLTQQIKGEINSNIDEEEEIKVGQWFKFVNILSYFFGCGIMNQKKISTDSCDIYIYITQIRLIWLSVIAVLIYALHYLQHVSPYFSIGLILILLISISLFVYSLFYAKKMQTAGNNNNTFSEACKWINTMFGIKNRSICQENIDDLFDFDRRIWGFCYLFLTVLACINSLICRATNIIEVWSSTGPTVAYMIGLSACLCFTSFYRVSSLYIEDMNNYIFDSDGNNNNLTPKISKLNKFIQNELKTEWKKSQLIENRKLEITMSFIICLAFHLIVYGHFKDYIFTSNLQLITIICCVYIYIIDSMILSMAFFLVFGFIYYYRFPSYILELFSYQFDSDSINDIVSWWELRKYYTQCIIEIYARSGLQMCIGATLVGFIALSFLVLQSAIYGQDQVVLGLVRLGFTITVAMLTIIATTMAVSVYNAQLPHIHTLNKEKLRLVYINNKDDDDNDGFSNRGNMIFEQIVKDVKENVYCLSVFGIGMTPAFLLLLKTTAVTVVVTVVSFIQG